MVAALVLVGVGGGEQGDGLVEHVGAAEVDGDGDPVPGAGVRPRQRPRAEFAVDPQPVRQQGLNVGGELPVSELADIEVALLVAVQPGLDQLPAQENVA